MKKNELQDVVRVLKDNNSFLIAGHVSPDGDSLGSMCALALGLESIGKTCVMVAPDGVPETYRFLPGSQRIVRESQPNQPFDVGIIVDCEGLDRIGSAADAMSACKSIVEIDHHPGGERNSHAQVIDSSAASCGEIVLEVLTEAGIAISPEIAECLLTAIITDTGSFRFSSVKPSTLRAAAELVEAGGSVSKIAHSIYEMRSFSAVKLLGVALSTIQTAKNGRIAYASITKQQMAEAQAVDAEAEGIVNYVRSVKGAQVGLLFRENGEGGTKVSLRSKDGYDISQVAGMFGGGGHRAAAGCTINRPLSEAIDLVVEATAKWMGS